MGFLASIVDLSKETELTPEDVLVVKDYVPVFLKDLPRLPLDRETVFSIEIMLRTTFVFQAPYQLVPTELKKLKV